MERLLPHHLQASECLRCANSRTVISGKNVTYMLCQAKDAPRGWPKYPPQPMIRCPLFLAKPAPPDSNNLVDPT